MSDTPISDSTPHNVPELGMLCRRLERELNAANERIKRLEAGDAALTYSIGLDLQKENDALKDRIKRLEESRTVAAANSLANMLSYEDAIMKIQRMEEALAWYETKVSDCNRQGPEGDAARDALAKDYGRKAKEAKL